MPPLSPLPIDPLVPDIVAKLKAHRSAVVIAPPGAGKTTRIPPALLDAIPPGDHVLVLQPRRVAARAASARIAHERGWQVGEEVGYQIRFENRCGPRTRLRVLTEGILTRRLESDQTLERVGCVVLDEFHERSIHTDTALAMLREIQQALRPELMILVMSATMDPRPVSEFLAGAPIIESPGRLHPVDIEFIDRPSRAPIWEQAASTARRALADDDSGHVLVFLPGIGEIRRTESLLNQIPAELHVLHSSVSSADQDRALKPTPTRKLILATNIAETSLTIDGIRSVIDTGLARVPISDPRLGIDRLELRRISRASADQRAGRAGRTAPGRCFRLWTRIEDAALDPAEAPDIKRVDLAATILSLLAYGANPERFGWFEPPRPDAITQAMSLLNMLGAVLRNGRLTELGRRLARLPLHPRIGRMLLAGAESGVLEDAALLAAIVSERDLLASPARRRPAGYESGSDLIERLERLRARDPEIDPQAAGNIRRVADDLIEAVRRAAKPHHAKTQDSGLRTQDFLLRLPLFGWPDRVTLRRENDPSRGVMVGGRGIVLEPSSVVRRAPLFLSIDPRDPESVRPGAPFESRVSLASAIEPQWLDESFPHLIERKTGYHFDTERGRVMGLRQTLFAGLVVREESVGAEPNTESAQALYEYLSHDINKFFLQFEPAARWSARVALLRRYMPELKFQENDDINATNGEVLRKACERQTTPAGAQARLVPILDSLLDHKQRRALAEHAPETVAIPSGRRVRLDYPESGPPVLAVKIQDLFGLAQGPRVAAGRVPVLLHLLAPNSRPVQITSDLASFWKTGYAEVRKTLRARYPRHPWPEDPKRR